MRDWTDRIEPGTVVQWIVGMPGPDLDMAIVTECYGPGHHQIMYQVYGKGPYHLEELKVPLWPNPKNLGKADQEQAEKLRHEYLSRKERDAWFFQEGK